MERREKEPHGYAECSDALGGGSHMGVLSVLMPWVGEGPGQSFLAGSFVSPEQNRQRERSRRAQFCRILRALLGTLRGRGVFGRL